MPTLEYKIQHIIIKLSTTPSGTKEGISLNCRSHAWLKRKTFLASNRLLDDIILSKTIQVGQSNLWWVSGKEFLSCLKQNPRLYIHLKGDYDAECQFPHYLYGIATSDSQSETSKWGEEWPWCGEFVLEEDIKTLSRSIHWAQYYSVPHLSSVMNP